MKRYCKNIELNKDFLVKSINECLSDKWKRWEVAKFLSEYTKDKPERMLEAIEHRDRKHMDKAVELAAKSMTKEIKDRNIRLPPIRYETRIDGNSGKIREIGSEPIKQQAYNYAAVNGLMELLNRKIGEYQCASIPKRGQVFGKKAIEKWIRKTPDKARVAAKGDIQKCYPSINKDRLKELLRKQVKNDDLLYLTFSLIDSYKQGLSIGSYLSQWLCNYYLSFAYHYASEKLFKVKKRRNGNEERIRLINHVLFYMDDFVLIGSRKADVKRAMKMLIKYINDFLDLNVKADWILFQIDWIDENKKHHGQHIDMMGYKIYRDRTEVRRGIFLRARRSYIKMWGYMKRNREPPLHLVYKCIAYYGWLKNSDSKHFVKKYKVEQIIKYSKRRISNESKISRKTTTSTVARTR